MPGKSKDAACWQRRFLPNRISLCVASSKQAPYCMRTGYRTWASLCCASCSKGEGKRREVEKDRDRVMGRRERRLSYRQIGNSVLGGSTTPVIVVAVLMSTSNTTSWVAASVQRQTAFLAIWNATSLSSDWPGLEFERIHHLLFKTAK
jgi:hypothetical protein